MLASCTVFYEAHDEAIAFFGLNTMAGISVGRLNECLDSTLATNKIIACRVASLFRGLTVIRTLEPERCDAWTILENCGDFGLADLESESAQWNGLYPLGSLGLDLLTPPPEIDVWAAIRIEKVENSNR